MSKEKEIRSRKWGLVINNTRNNLTYDVIKTKQIQEEVKYEVEETDKETDSKEKVKKTKYLLKERIIPYRSAVSLSLMTEERRFEFVNEREKGYDLFAFPFKIKEKEEIIVHRKVKFHQSYIQSLLENNFDETQISYYCMSDEVGENGNFHTHIYLVFRNAVSFSKIKSIFPFAHIDFTKGTNQENRDYVFKEGRWEKDKKSDTNWKFSHFEFGELPQDTQGKRGDLEWVVSAVDQGWSYWDIVHKNPDMLAFDKPIHNLIKERDLRASKNTRRLDLCVTWQEGVSACGKTRSVMDEFGDGNVCQVTDYKYPFDSYDHQNCVLFEEFYSSEVKLREMLTWLDVYHFDMKARYYYRIPFFHFAVINSNYPLHKQYVNMQKENALGFEAFLRRINKIKVFTKYMKWDEYTVVEYLVKYKNEFEKNGLDYNKFKYLQIPTKTEVQTIKELFSSDAFIEEDSFLDNNSESPFQ